MRRIAIYRHQLFKPSETFITEQALALRRFDPVFVGREIAGAAPESSEVRSLQAAGLVARTRHTLFRATHQLVTQMEHARPALVHAHFGVEGVYALGLAKRLGVPLVTTFHGFDATLGVFALIRARKVSWAHYVVGRHELAAQGDLFICSSEFIHQRVRAMGFPAPRCVTHYIGVDTRKITPSVSPGSGMILHVARLVEVKGTRYLLEAFAEIRRRLPRTILVIIGDGPLRPALERLARRLGVDDAVRFLGYQSHAVVREWMQRATVFSLPSVTARSGQMEGLGLVVLEAAAAAVPAVVTDHGGLPETLRDGETGYLVPERDPQTLADRLSAMLEDEALRDGMGRAARRMTESRFDLARQTEKLEDLYERLL